MEMGKLDIEEIKSHIHLFDDGEWKNTFETNCYAYALGLDYPEDKIFFHAYQLGAFFAIQKRGYIPNNLGFYPYDERLELDLKTLKIDFKEVDPKVKNYSVTHDKNTDYYWSIALFDGCMDFHFLRKGFDGKWYHKNGYLLNPTNRDKNNKIILDPRKCNLGHYEYKKTYQLKLTRKSSDE